MYAARFDLAGHGLVQISARIESVSTRGQNRADWNWASRQLSAAIRQPGHTLARRISLDSNRNLQQIIALTASSNQEADLRQAVARLTRSERFTGTSITLPASRAERDKWFDFQGIAEFCTVGDYYSIGGIPVACDFRILPRLNPLLTEAYLAGHPLTYQIHIRSVRIDPENIRQARRFVVALGDLPAIRGGIVENQQRMASRLERAAAICEEYVCADSNEAANWLKLWISEQFQATHASFGFGSDAFLRPGIFDERLTAALHSYDFEPWSPADLSGGALSSDERDSLLAWQPDERLDRLLSPGDPFTDPPTPVPLSPTPRTYHGEERFVFASYKRQDLPIVAKVLTKLREFGVPVWYDAQIPGGSEWDEVIEDRLTKAKGVLAFTSAAAIESKYVRREIKFADAIGRPVLGILLEDVTLRHGLQMLMTQYQMLDIRAADFEPRLRHAVTRLFQA